MTKLIKAKPLLYNISLITYIFLIIRQLIKPYFFSNPINYSNIIILISIYIYESFVALVLKQSILYSWKIKDYTEHHIIFSIFMLIYYYFVDLKKYYLNTQNYLVFINFNEITYILQNYNVSKKFLIVSKFYTLFNISNLIYYEITESYTYYKSIKNNKKYISILVILASLYHIFLVIPSNLKQIKKTINNL
tara:strand:+ start:100 stop:675 length:576 start_codon:yes stop_codon:yes gene_type:complete